VVSALETKIRQSTFKKFFQFQLAAVHRGKIKIGDVEVTATIAFDTFGGRTTVFVMLEMDYKTTFDMGASLELHGRAAHVERATAWCLLIHGDQGESLGASLYMGTRAKAWCLLTHGDQGGSLVPPYTRGPGRKPGASFNPGSRAKAWCLLTHGDQGGSLVPPYTR